MTTKVQAESDPAFGARGAADVEALGAAICKEVVLQGCEFFGARLRAIILTGSLARSEATFVEDDCWGMLGDAEFMLLFQTNAELPSSATLKLVQSMIERNLRRLKIQCRIDLSGVRPSYLRRLPPHVFTYELRNCGRVIWGDGAVLSMIPSFSGSEISLEDAWHLLCNRLVEFLEIAPDLTRESGDYTPHLAYQIVKLHLDMATSFLIFVGAYAPSYRDRAEKLRRLVERANEVDWPFEPETFAREVAACSEWKLSPERDENGPMEISWQGAIKHAHALWRWELVKLTGSSERLSDRTLLQRWTRCQPYKKRLRGWLYVVRACGWHRSWRHWPHWARQLLRTSPRHQVYLTATQLVFQLPELFGDAARHCEKGAQWTSLRDSLPAVSESSRSQKLSAWEHLASEIFRNYQEFLAKTRA